MTRTQVKTFANEAVSYFEALVAGLGLSMYWYNPVHEHICIGTFVAALFTVFSGANWLVEIGQAAGDTRVKEFPTTWRYAAAITALVFFLTHGIIGH